MANIGDLNNIEKFALKYLSHYLKCRVPEFHRDLYDLAISDCDRLVVAAPRSFAKSTVFSLIQPLYEIFFGTARKIFMVSNTGALAQQWIRMIKSELETNAVLRAEMGDVVTDKKWTEDHIICRRNKGELVEIVAKGAGYQLRGFRPDLIIIDDIETDDGVRSELQREKLLDWFNKALINTLEQDSRLRMIGTNMHPLSLLSNVMERDNWVVRKYQAFTDEEETQSLWPEKWSVEDLKERRSEIGTRAFASEFMNDPIIQANPIFVRNWFQFYDLKDQEVIDDLHSRVRTVVACDPAISMRDGSDYTAIVVVSLVRHGNDLKYYVRDIVRGHWPVSRTVGELVKRYDDFSGRGVDDSILVEDVAFQAVLGDELELHKETKYRDFDVVRVKPLKDKVMRAEAIVSEVQRGDVYFLKDEHRLLLNELFLFPTGAHDDLVDAFGYAITELKYTRDAIREPITSALAGAAW